MRCSKIGTIRGDKKYPPDLDIAPKGKTTCGRCSTPTDWPRPEPRSGRRMLK